MALVDGNNGGQGTPATGPPPEGDLSQFRGHPVHLEAFDGPLDLLLHLIKKDRIEIWQISISRITRQYLQYLSTLQALNIELAGEFLVMAATLMRIKSQNLLPRPSFLPDEDDGEEPLTKEDLIARLVEYRKYREAAQAMASLETRQSRMFPRGSVVTLEPGARLPLREPKLLDLAEYLHELLNRKEPVTGHQVHLEEFRLEDQMDWVLQCLETNPLETNPLETNPLELTEELEGNPAAGSERGARALRFARLLRRTGAQLEVVVTFLAILELARLQRLRIWQRQALHEIWLTARARSEAGPQAGPEVGTEAGPEETIPALEEETR
jgi:segregation and condensation protein A